MINVLIVDDSLTTREYLKQIINSDPVLRIAGEAKNGEEAVVLTESKKPDVVIMDIQMPGINGYEATRSIMEKCPVPIIVHSTLFAPEQTENIFKAMKAGAVAVSQKPPGIGHPDSKHLVEKLLKTIKLMSEVKVIRLLKQKTKRHGHVKEHLHQKVSAKAGSQVEIIAIGASTGGPPVLQSILSNLKTDFTIPIMIVQHIANGFLEGMVEWLSKTTPIPLKIPKAGERVKSGHVYFAPEDHQVGITASHNFHIHKTFNDNNLKRPINYLFSSVAQTYKKKSIGILLTGMGSDGAVGLKEMKTKKAITIAQDSESCVVFGMPKEAIKLDAATYILSPPDITAFLNKISRNLRK